MLFLIFLFSSTIKYKVSQFVDQKRQQKLWFLFTPINFRRKTFFLSLLASLFCRLFLPTNSQDKQKLNRRGGIGEGKTTITTKSTSRNWKILIYEERKRAAEAHTTFHTAQLTLSAREWNKNSLTTLTSFALKLSSQETHRLCVTVVLLAVFCCCLRQCVKWRFFLQFNLVKARAAVGLMRKRCDDERVREMSSLLWHVNDLISASLIKHQKTAPTIPHSSPHPPKKWMFSNSTFFFFFFKLLARH